jgi:two-component system, cell cycle response regulator DivK
MAGEPILVIDDNATNMKLLRVLLTTEGYEVRTAIDAREAIEVMKNFRPRLILMDLQLPGMSGFELTRLLKADAGTRDITILAVTAYAMKGDEERARAAGCDGYVSKPIDTRALASTIAQRLSAR